MTTEADGQTELQAETTDSGVAHADEHQVERDLVTDDNDRFLAETVTSEDGAKAQPAKAGDEKAGEDKANEVANAAAEKGATARFLADGSYQVTRPDGTKITLSEAEVARVARTRIDRATRKYRELERTLEEQRRSHQAELDKFKREVRGEGSGDGDGEKPWAVKGAPRPSLDDFDSVEDYNDARDEWKAAQEAPASDAGNKAPPEQIRALAAGVSSMLEEGAKRFPDFDAVVRNNAEAPFDQTMAQFLLTEAEDAPAIFHYLGSNVEDAKQIRQMLADGDTKGAYRALVRAEARIGDIDPGDTEQGDEPRTPATPAAQTAHISKAPKPITPISGGAPVTRDPENESTDSYMARRRAEEARRMR